MTNTLTMPKPGFAKTLISAACALGLGVALSHDVHAASKGFITSKSFTTRSVVSIQKPSSLISSRTNIYPSAKAVATMDESRVVSLAAGDNHTGGIHSPGDIDEFTLEVVEEGTLEIEVKAHNSRPNVDLTLKDEQGKNIETINHSEGARKIKLQAGSYSLTVEDLMSFSLYTNGRYTGIPKYTVSTRFTPKPSQQALLVLLENDPNAADVSETEVFAAVNLADVLDNNGLGNVVSTVESMFPGLAAYTLENVAAQGVLEIAGDHYDQIIVIEDEELTQKNVLETLSELAPDYLVDIHVLTHGGDEFFQGEESFGTYDGFFTHLSDIKDLYLRTVYQMNCFGSSLNDQWVDDGGAAAVNGADMINYLPPSYFWFLEEWVNGEEFEKAVRSAYNMARPVAQFGYSFIDLYQESGSSRSNRNPAQINIFGQLSSSDELNDSRMLINGPNKNVTIDQF